jgi:hypothetical protein
LEDLAKKVQKVLFSIKSRVASLGNIPIKVSNNLFDDNTKASFNKEFTLSVWSRARYNEIIMKCPMGNLPSSAHTPIFEKSLKPFIKRELKNKYKQMCENKIKSFNENSKMFLYKKLKLNLEREFYLSYVLYIRNIRLVKFCALPLEARSVVNLVLQDSYVMYVVYWCIY